MGQTHGAPRRRTAVRYAISPDLLVPGLLMTGAGRMLPTTTRTAVPPFDNDKRPAWLNWVFLAIFLWSSYQLAGFWFEQLHH